METEKRPDEQPGDPIPLEPPRVRVLTMDGGPSAMLQVRLLRCIEEREPGFLARTQMFAGTSLGAFVTLYLAARRTEGRLSSLETLDGAIAFVNKLCKILHASFCGTLRFASGLGPLNRSGELEDYLSSPEVYGSLRMHDLSVPTLAVSLDAFRWRGRVFRNFPPYSTEQPQDLPLVEVALASSAFPMLLPMHYIADSGHFADGGLVANNPAMVALSSALPYLATLSQLPPGGLLRDLLPQVTVLSLGAFECPHERVQMELSWVEHALSMVPCLNRVLPWFVGPGDRQWGWWQWVVARPAYLPDLVLQGSIEEVSLQCHELLATHFHRSSPLMDEVAQVTRAFFGRLKNIEHRLDERCAQLVGQKSFEHTVGWVQNVWMNDNPPSGYHPPPLPVRPANCAG